MPPLSIISYSCGYQSDPPKNNMGKAIHDKSLNYRQYGNTKLFKREFQTFPV